jgi:DNA repair protein RecO (recombination protein O)
LFEKRLLQTLGYGLELAQTDDGMPVQADRYYRFAAQSGPQPCVADAPDAVYGQSLHDLDAGNLQRERSLRDAKRLLRAAIDDCLDGRALKSRTVMLALHRRTARPTPAVREESPVQEES